MRAWLCMLHENEWKGTDCASFEVLFMYQPEENYEELQNNRYADRVSIRVPPEYIIHVCSLSLFSVRLVVTPTAHG